MAWKEANSIAYNLKSRGYVRGLGFVLNGLGSCLKMNEEKPVIPYKFGQVVQLDPDKTRNKMFAGCMLTITEVESWGVQGYVQSLGKNGEMGGAAFYRANFDEFAYVGTAAWVMGDEDNG